MAAEAPALEAAAESLQRAARGEDAPHSSAEESTASRADSSAEESTAPPSPRVAEVLTMSPYLPDESFAARRADALVLMAETLLAHGAAELLPGERHQVVVHVDAAVLSDARRDGRAEIENGPPLAVETVRRLLCDGSIVPMTDDADGNPLNVGRRTRAIPPALRRALQSRDGGCRFPGCSHKRFADGHHIEHWADGGETKLDNLVLLCRTHHRFVHEEGFRVERATDGGLGFRAPDGRRVEDAPARCMLAHDPVLALIEANLALGIGARTCIPEWMGEKPDYDWITDALWRRDKRVRNAAQARA